MTYRGTPLQHDAMAWLEVALCLFAAFAIWLLVRLATNRRPTAMQAALSGFAGYFLITVWLFFAALLIVPAYLASGIALAAAAIISGHPVGPFLREYFYHAFVPAYAAFAVLTIHWLYGDDISRFLQRLRRE